MKNFIKPVCEVVHFNDIIAASNTCGCWDGEDDWGVGATCKSDMPQCACQVNYNPAIANCIIPD